MWFEGQKIVCINDNWKAEWFRGSKVWVPVSSEIYPIRNQIYTIQEIVDFSELNPPALGFHLYEIVHLASWHSDHFQPLTDISTFKEILKKIPTKDLTKELV